MVSFYSTGYASLLLYITRKQTAVNGRIYGLSRVDFGRLRHVCLAYRFTPNSITIPKIEHNTALLVSELDEGT